MNSKKRWLTGAALTVLCLVAGLAGTAQLQAAGTDTQQESMTYLDPFDLTISSMSSENDGWIVNRAVSENMVSMSSVTSYKPVQIWIPYRPRFRSPCTPRW